MSEPAQGPDDGPPQPPALPQDLQDLPPEVLAKISAQFYSGLIPHPDILKGYEELVPGAAKRILDTFDDQSHHRIRIEAKTIDSDIHRSWVGLAAGVIVALAVLWVAREAILAGRSVEGTFLATIDLSSLVGIFVYVGRERRAERDEKAKLMQPRGSDTERTGDIDAELRRRGARERT